MTDKEIKNAVDDIINNLDKKDFEHEAINWTDLKVNEVSREITVCIDEAAPECRSFRNAIEEIFYQKYGIAITVITEW